MEVRGSPGKPGAAVPPHAASRRGKQWMWRRGARWFTDTMGKEEARGDKHEPPAGRKTLEKERRDGSTKRI